MVRWSPELHGPQPDSWEASVDAERTEEVAVMLDTFASLLVAEGAVRDLGDEAYLASWDR